ncbi:recombinase family protein, partial [Oenococcus oeni]|uniref:recombinase family protein n=1 Tax=Oenococcus oeni TaxID=1247 RepID=UPI000AE54008
MKIAYARVSSQEQNLARQIARLKAIPVDRIFAKKQSGKNFSERNKLKNLLFSLKKGDIVYVTSLDRLGRNANDLTNGDNTLDVSSLTINNVSITPSTDGSTTSTVWDNSASTGGTLT